MRIRANVPNTRALFRDTVTSGTLISAVTRCFVLKVNSVPWERFIDCQNYYYVEEKGTQTAFAWLASSSHVSDHSHPRMLLSDFTTEATSILDNSDLDWAMLV